MTTDADRAARTSGVFLDRSDRVRVEITGADRAKFLHNLTTNDVKRLGVGQGVEAFVTSPQGKTIGYVTLLAADDRILLRTDPGGAGLVLPHLRKYGVFDEVGIEDVSGATFEFHAAGPAAGAALARALGRLPAGGDLRHEWLEGAETGAATGGVRVVNESPYGVPGLTLIGGVATAGGVREWLRSLGAVEITGPEAEALRIEAGTPVFGRDVTPENLPQEVARDDRAINFVKGCYLGQETVARLDALGHVNKILRGFRIAGGPADVPPDGAAIEADGKVVGKITSAAFSAGSNGPVALGYVRTSHAEPGTGLTVVVGETRLPGLVCVWPAGPPAGG